MKALFAALMLAAFSFTHQPPADSVLLSPVTRGSITLPETKAELFLGFGTVNQNTRLTVSQTDVGLQIEFQPVLASTVIPMLMTHAGDMFIVDAPGVAEPIPVGDYLIYFDTVQVFAQHSQRGEVVFSIGMIEGFNPALPVRRAGDPVHASIDPQGRHTLLDDERKTFVAASQLPRYSRQFIGQALTNPASFQFLGWAEAADLPGIIRTMFPAVPHDADLPAPGERVSTFPLWLPFDCAEDWVVSWGYHYSTHQNRYAVDFAALAGGGMAEGLPVRAAHDGSAALKIFGYDGHYIDLGIAVRVIDEDGITATEYGHLDESTLAYWQLADITPFEWVAVGDVSAGDVIGFTGKTGYATGAHIHFALWTYDQSIYRPLFGQELERGLALPAAARADCGRYQ